MASLPSASRARRLRNAATKQRLFQKCANVEPLTGSAAKLETLIDLLQSITFALQSTISGWPMYSDTGYAADIGMNMQYCCNSFETDDLHGRAYVQQMDGSSGKTHEHTIVPTPTEDSPVLCLWRPGAKSNFCREGSSLRAEWLTEAAIVIQRFVRSHMISFDSSSNASSALPSTCEACNQAFAKEQFGDDYPDRCDKCGAFRHSSCLLSCKDVQGECAVCTACQQEWSLDIMKQQEDVTVTDAAHEGNSTKCAQVCATTPPSEPCPPTAGPPDPLSSGDSPGASGGIGTHYASGPKEATSAEEVLETRLDYMLRYLELGKQQLPQQTKDMVMQLVKGALTWKKERRTEGEIQDKVKELDSAMTKIVGQG